MTKLTLGITISVLIASLCACQMDGEIDANVTNSVHHSRGLPSSAQNKVSQASVATEGKPQLSDFAQIWSASASVAEVTSNKQNQSDLRDSQEYKRLQTYIAAANYSAATGYASSAAMKDLIRLEIQAHQEMLQVEAVTAKIDQEPKDLKEL